MSRNNLLARGQQQHQQHQQQQQTTMGQPLLPTQIGVTQFMQPPLEKLYWDRSPNGSYSATTNYIRTSIPPPPLSQNQHLQQTGVCQAPAPQWSPVRQPVLPYHTSFSQSGHLMTAQIPTEFVHTGGQLSTSPFFPTNMISYTTGGSPGGLLQSSPGPTFIHHQYPPQGSQYHQQAPQFQNQFENQEIAAQMVHQAAAMAAKSTAVSIGTPAAMINNRMVNRGNLMDQPAMKLDSHMPIEEVEEELTMIDSPQHLPPVPGSARSIAEQRITSSNGPLTNRASPSRITYESSPMIMQAPLSDRVVVSSRHQRVTSSPATVSPRDQQQGAVVGSSTFFTGMQQNITSDLLRMGLFWPVLNPLIDMLRLIEVVDYRSATTFKSIVLGISPDSSVKELLIQFGDTHDILMKLDPVNVSCLNGLALIKCALKEEEIITMKSVATGKAFKISVKQLLLSGLTACQGKYLLSDTEHIKFGIQLSFNVCSGEQSAPLVCVCPQSVHYEVKSLQQQTASRIQSTDAPPTPEQVVIPRHIRDLSADCIKSNRPISATKLFLLDGTPAYNRLLVKVEGFEGFEDVPRDIPAVYLRASLGGGTKGYRCKVDNWLGEDAHAEFDFDYRGNRTIKFSIINASENTGIADVKEVIGTTQLNLLALLSLSKNQFRGSLPVNSEGRVLGRLKVGALFTNASATNLIQPFFKAFSWAQALIGGTFIKITLHQLQGSLHSAHDPLFFRVSCGGVKVRSAKFTPVKSAKSMDLKDEVMELPITPELLAASEQKDFILCVYSRYNSETSCHTASHYVKILPSVIDMPSLTPRTTRIENAIMTPAAQEYAGEDFLITFTFGVHK